MMRSNDGWSSGAWVAMVVVMLAFWGVLVAALFAFVRSARSPSTGSGDNGSGEGLPALDERLARGDIDAAEFSRSRDLLRSP